MRWQGFSSHQVPMATSTTCLCLFRFLFLVLFQNCFFTSSQRLNTNSCHLRSRDIHSKCIFSSLSVNQRIAIAFLQYWKIGYTRTPSFLSCQSHWIHILEPRILTTFLHRIQRLTLDCNYKWLCMFEILFLQENGLKFFSAVDSGEVWPACVLATGRTKPDFW